MSLPPILVFIDVSPKANFASLRLARLATPEPPNAVPAAKVVPTSDDTLETDSPIFAAEVDILVSTLAPLEE